MGNHQKNPDDNRDASPPAATRGRDVTARAEDEARAWQGDFEARRRRASDEAFDDPRGYGLEHEWETAGLEDDDRADSITSVVDTPTRVPGEGTREEEEP